MLTTQGLNRQARRLRNNEINSDITEMLKAGQWKDEHCFVVGGGPSLSGFDFSRLRGRGRVIAVNKAFYDCPFADVLIGMDHSFFRWADTGRLAKGELGKKYRDAYRAFKGIKVFIVSRSTRVTGVKIAKRTQNPKYIGKMEAGIYTGNNAGVGALSFAAMMGCNPIYLLGMDCTHNKKSHFHDGYPQRIQTKNTARSFISHFRAAGNELKKAGFQIYNCSPISKINTFPKIDIDEVLK
jgi:hypothetical protein